MHQDCRNLIYPDIVYDDANFTAFYDELPDLRQYESWLDHQLVLDAFNRAKAIANLVASTFDRKEFGDTSVVNGGLLGC